VLSLVLLAMPEGIPQAHAQGREQHRDPKFPGWAMVNSVAFSPDGACVPI
jgi:hypothetical protein